MDVDHITHNPKLLIGGGLVIVAVFLLARHSNQNALSQSPIMYDGGGGNSSGGGSSTIAQDVVNAQESLREQAANFDQGLTQQQQKLNLQNLKDSYKFLFTPTTGAATTGGHIPLNSKLMLAGHNNGSVVDTTLPSSAPAGSGMLINPTDFLTGKQLLDGGNPAQNLFNFNNAGNLSQWASQYLSAGQSSAGNYAVVQSNNDTAIKQANIQGHISDNNERVQHEANNDSVISGAISGVTSILTAPAKIAQKLFGWL